MGRSLFQMVTMPYQAENGSWVPQRRAGEVFESIFPLYFFVLYLFF